MSSIFMALLGIGTAFLGLICLGVWKIAGNTASHPSTQPMPAPESAAAPAPIQMKPAVVSPELIAAISAAIAEDLGTDISGIRITSIRQI